MSLKNVVIVGGKRTPFVRSFGKYQKCSNKDMLSHVLKALVEQYQLSGKKVDEVVLGAVMKHAGDWNLARESVLSSGLAAETPAFDLQRACGTGLEAACVVANKIALGQIKIGIAGGSDTNSDLPLQLSDSLSQKFIKLSRAKSMGEKLKLFSSVRPKDFLPKMPTANEPRTKKSMGQHCELMAKEWNITRQEQDQLALEAHLKTAKAYDEGFYQDLVSPFCGVERDDITRADTTIETLSKLRPAFDKNNGTLTAGNSTPLTDGASCVLLADEQYAKEQGLPILAKLVDFQSYAVDFVGGEGLLIAPAYAVHQLLERSACKLQDFCLYEIHEAFSAQVLCTLKAWEDEGFCRSKLGAKSALGPIDRQKLNVKGGSVAIGHPFAATGARLVAGLGKMMSEKTSGERGLISVCTAGGMGVAAIVEAL